MPWALNWSAAMWPPTIDPTVKTTSAAMSPIDTMRWPMCSQSYPYSANSAPTAPTTAIQVQLLPAPRSTAAAPMVLTPKTT